MIDHMPDDIRPDQAAARGFRAALRAPGFRRLVVGQAVSSLGDWVATLAFIAAAFAASRGNQTAVAVVLVLRLVPPIFAAPVGGVVADRRSRRTIMVTCDLSRATLIAIVPFGGLGLLYALAFVHECLSLFFLPARDASVPLLAPADSLEEANGLILASSYGSIPIAAALFGLLRVAASHIPAAVPFAPLFRRHPTAFAFFFDSATFVFSAAMIAGLPLRRDRRPAGTPLRTDLAEGVRFIARHPGLRSLAYGLIVAMFGGGVLFAVGIGYVKETLGASDAAFGWLSSLWGLGMGLGLLLVRRVVSRGRARVFVVAVAACGAVLIVMALVPIVWLAFVVAVGFGAAFSAAIVVALTLAQEATSDDVRGRVMGAVQMLFRVGLGLGALGIGALARAASRGRPFGSLDGNQVGMLAGGAVIILGALAAAGVIRPSAWAVPTYPGDPPMPGPA
jgi:dTMP kinase